MYIILKVGKKLKKRHEQVQADDKCNSGRRQYPLTFIMEEGTDGGLRGWPGAVQTESCPLVLIRFQQQVFVEMRGMDARVLAHLEENSTLGSSYTPASSPLDFKGFLLDFLFARHEKQLLSSSPLK